MRGPGHFLVGPVECDRKCFKVASTCTLQKVNVASAEGASGKVCDLQHAGTNRVVGASTVGASESCVDFAY